MREGKNKYVYMFITECGRDAHINLPPFWRGVGRSVIGKSPSSFWKGACPSAWRKMRGGGEKKQGNVSSYQTEYCGPCSLGPFWICSLHPTFPPGFRRKDKPQKRIGIRNDGDQIHTFITSLGSKEWIRVTISIQPAQHDDSRLMC